MSDRPCWAKAVAIRGVPRKMTLPKVAFILDEQLTN